MSETQTMQPFGFAEGFNPFSDDVQPVQNTVQENVQEVKTEEAPVLGSETNAAVTENAPSAQTQEAAPSFDPNQFVKEKFGFSSVEEAEQEFNRLKSIQESQAEATPSFEFKDDNSRKLFEAIKEGKIDDVYEVISQQKRIEKLVTSDLNPNIAAEIIKTGIQSKYKDLTQDEVDLLFYENYFIPAKPEQSYEESDEDFQKKLDGWQQQVDYVNKKMIIDAKIYRPDIEKLKQELVLPDVYKQANDGEDVAKEQELLSAARSVYEQVLNSEFQSFNGFEVKVKDEEVELPISFGVGEDERLQMKEMLSDFDADSYLENRWFAEDGKPKIQQIMADIYLLENREKIFQKVANEAASQRLLHHLKKSGNVTIQQPTPQGTPKPNPTAEMDRLAEWAFSA